MKGKIAYGSVHLGPDIKSPNIMPAMSSKELQKQISEMRRSEERMQSKMNEAAVINSFRKFKDSMTNWQSANFNGGVQTYARNYR